MSESMAKAAGTMKETNQIYTVVSASNLDDLTENMRKMLADPKLSPWGGVAFDPHNRVFYQAVSRLPLPPSRPLSGWISSAMLIVFMCAVIGGSFAFVWRVFAR